MSDFLKPLKKRAATAVVNDSDMVTIPLDELNVAIRSMENLSDQIVEMEKQIDQLQQSVGSAALFGFDGAIGCLQRARQSILDTSAKPPITGGIPNGEENSEAGNGSTTGIDTSTGGTSGSADAVEPIEPKGNTGRRKPKESKGTSKRRARTAT